MEKVKFSELETGQRFKYNLMYWKKKRPQMENRNENSIPINSSFLSDDHYESGRTDVFIGSPGAMFKDHVMVEPVHEMTRREKFIANQ